MAHLHHAHIGHEVFGRVVGTLAGGHVQHGGTHPHQKGRARCGQLVDDQTEKAFGQTLNHVAGDGHRRGGASDGSGGVNHRHARFRAENQLVDTLKGVFERADGLGILHPVWLFTQPGFAAPENFGYLPHGRQVVAAVRRIDDGFDGVCCHGGKAFHIGPVAHRYHGGGQKT